MAELDGTEPIDDHELLYRRIPVSMGWYSGGTLSPEAFNPRQDELTGVSIYRDKYKTLEEVAKGKGKKGYFVAVFRAGDLRQHGIDVVPRPNTTDGYDPGHAELPGLTAENCETASAREKKLALSTLAIDVKGPFVATPTNQALG
ncbi:MAG: hypothetical protein NT013_19040 [Planctomycetia bacterium]|nr:hypothetical protein [Planctomycetia bacterium]